MAFYRVKHNENEKIFDPFEDYNRPDEWENDSRLDDLDWISRYEHEAKVLEYRINEHKLKTILEIGSGPGGLCKHLDDLGALDGITYHMIDKKNAKKSHDKREWPGKIFVQDLRQGVDSKGLLESYDLIVCNDVLEHLPNPTKVIQDLYHLNNNKLWISIPNWRMGHQFFYRGLFDYDNFLYFMKTHKYTGIAINDSPLKTPMYAKLESEQLLPDEYVRSWNWYLLFDKVVTKN